MAKVIGIADGRPDILFETLLRPHFDALYGRAMQLAGDVADAEDLVQDLCVRVYPRLDELESIDNPRAWLMRVLYRLFIDMTRVRQRSPLRPMEAVDGGSLIEAESGEPGPEEQTEAILMHARLERAWRYLEAEQRMLLVLQSIDGLSLAEIEEITGIAQGTLKSRLHRARIRLGRLLAREDGACGMGKSATNKESRSSDDELPRNCRSVG